MTDRSALLAAIKANPNEFTPRLVYADWLEEFGASDLDAATVEFIRVSCAGGATKLMPRAAFAWIKENWTRLIPTALAKRSHTEIHWRREGRGIYLRYAGIVADGWARPFIHRASVKRPLMLNCHRGFVEKVTIWSFYAAQYLHPLIQADQPLCQWQFHGFSLKDPRDELETDPMEISA